MTGAAASAAATGLLLARGETAFLDFTGAAQSLFGPAGSEVRQPPAQSTADPRAALEYFREHFGGEVPRRQLVLSELAPVAFAGYHLMHRAALKESALPPKTVELLMCAINASDYQLEFLVIHAGGARALGASEPELAEAALCAIPAAGIAAWPGAAEAIFRTRPS